MKILFLGPTAVGQTSRMRARALERLGHEVRAVDTVAPWKRAGWLSRQLQKRFSRGSIVGEINRSVLAAAREFSPDLIWAEKQEHLEPDSIEELRSTGARLVHFTPDPYFSVPWKRTATMDAAIKLFDVLIYCKSYERGEYEKVGRSTVYMPLGYCDEVHRPLLPADACWSSEIGFLGGWEPRRENLLNRLSQLDINLKIWGGYWDFLADGRWTLRRQVIMKQLAGGERFRIHQNTPLAACLQGGEVYGDDYARALSGAQIGVGFLRKVCPDQHTTRTFEIPACGSMLLADRTDEHREFFEEGVEAEFFDTTDELSEKAEYHSKHEEARARVARAGFERCERGRYAYIHRLGAVLETVARTS